MSLLIIMLRIEIQLEDNIVKEIFDLSTQQAQLSPLIKTPLTLGVALLKDKFCLWCNCLHEGQCQQQ